MISLVQTLWGFVCFMWQILLLSFCNRGGPNQTEQNSSIPGGDLESHNLGRECNQSLTPPPHCLGSQWQVSAGDWPKLYSRGFHSKLWSSPPRAHWSWSFYCEGADTGCQRDHRWNFPPHCFGESVHWQTPKSTWPWTFWKPMLSFFCLRVVGLKDLVSSYLQWGRKTLPTQIIHVNCLWEGMAMRMNSYLPQASGWQEEMLDLIYTI